MNELQRQTSAALTSSRRPNSCRTMAGRQAGCCCITIIMLSLLLALGCLSLGLIVVAILAAGMRPKFFVLRAFLLFVFVLTAHCTQDNNKGNKRNKRSNKEKKQKPDKKCKYHEQSSSKPTSSAAAINSKSQKASNTRYRANHMKEYICI